MSRANVHLFDVRESPIQGKGIFATRPIKTGGFIGILLEHIPNNTKLRQTLLSRYLNHSVTPNAVSMPIIGGFGLKALNNIAKDDELVIDYLACAQAVYPNSIPSMDNFDPDILHTDPRIRIIKHIGSFTIIEVDGSVIRRSLWKNFTNFAHHYDLSLIPLDELWIDRGAHSDEIPFYIHRMLIEYRFMATGMSYDETFDFAERAEHAERIKSLGRLEHKGVPTERFKLRLMGTTPSGKKVWIVNGKAIRDMIFPSFTEGGNWLVYGWIPKNEFFIDNDVQPHERGLILFHEMLEAKYMERGLTYKEAHEKATDAEWQARWKLPDRPPYESVAVAEIPFSKRAKDHSYVGKREEESGNITYLYDKKHIAARNRKKEKQLKKLSKSLKKVRATVKKDLSSENDKTRLSALAVALIDETYERIGNEESATELKHFGVTGWMVKHITFSKDKATIKYVGKSGVKQTKEIKTKPVLTALKRACEDKKKSDRILGISAKTINAYLTPFGITAKDIRGLHANKEMLRSLKENGKGKLPKDEKEREKELKKRFKDALEDAAKKVGHEPSTLKNQYLIPRIEQYFMEGKSVQSILASQELPFSKRATDTIVIDLHGGMEQDPWTYDKGKFKAFEGAKGAGFDERLKDLIVRTTNWPDIDGKLDGNFIVKKRDNRVYLNVLWDPSQKSQYGTPHWHQYVPLKNITLPLGVIINWLPDETIEASQELPFSKRAKLDVKDEYIWLWDDGIRRGKGTTNPHLKIIQNVKNGKEIKGIDHNSLADELGMSAEDAHEAPRGFVTYPAYGPPEVTTYGVSFNHLLDTHPKVYNAVERTFDLIPGAYRQIVLPLPRGAYKEILELPFSKNTKVE